MLTYALRGILVASALALPLVGLASSAGAEVTDQNVVQMVESAKTAADHQALASYFRAQASAAEASAEKHEKMIGALPGKPREPWRSHCQRLVRTFREQAKDYGALAAEQDALAKAGTTAQ